MATDYIRYDILTQEALRSVVRTVLTDAAAKGLPGEHHFYINIDTRAEGVKISPRLAAQYPEEMTIVLQHQFWDLSVRDDVFEVGLSFNGIPERLIVPLAAIKGFSTPPFSSGCNSRSKPNSRAKAPRPRRRRQATLPRKPKQAKNVRPFATSGRRVAASPRRHQKVHFLRRARTSRRTSLRVAARSFASTVSARNSGRDPASTDAAALPTIRWLGSVIPEAERRKAFATPAPYLRAWLAGSPLRDAPQWRRNHFYFKRLP